MEAPLVIMTVTVLRWGSESRYDSIMIQYLQVLISSINSLGERWATQVSRQDPKMHFDTGSESSPRGTWIVYPYGMVQNRPIQSPMASTAI